MDDPDALGSPQPLAAGEELSPQELLELIRTQHEGTARDIYVDPARILVSWGVAWMLGFGAFYFASSRARWHFVPLWAAAVVLVTLSAVAVAGVVTQMARRGRGVQGPSRTVGARYGWSWLLAFAGVFALNIGLSQHGLPASLAPLLWPGRSAVVAGVLYLAGGVLFAARVHHGLGGGMLAVPGGRGVFPGDRLVHPAPAPARPAAAMSTDTPASADPPRQPALPALDPVIHAQPRLRVTVTLATLADGDRITFPRLQELAGMTAGNLATHLRKLEDAGYVRVTKAYRRRTPVTWLSLTTAGRLALDEYTASLQALLANAARREAAPAASPG